MPDQRAAGGLLEIRRAMLDRPTEGPRPDDLKLWAVAHPLAKAVADYCFFRMRLMGCEPGDRFGRAADLCPSNSRENSA